MKKSLFASLLLLGSSMVVQAQEVLLDRIIAIVNNDVITETQLERMVNKVRFNAYQTGQAVPTEKQLKEQGTEQLIIESLQLQIAERMGMQISDAQLESTIDNILLRENKSRESLNQELIDSGLSYNDFRQDIRNELLIGEVTRAQVRQRISISPQEIDALVKLLEQETARGERYQLGHIVIRNSDGEQAEQAMLNELMAKLKAGEDFALLAQAYSSGPRAAQGGDWGWMSVDEMPSLFAQAIGNDAVQAGSIVGPFRSDSGLHILQIFDVQGSSRVEALEVNARHILIKPSIILSDARAKQLLSDLRQQLINENADFASLAREHSEDPGSAVRGGELGWADPRAYVPEFQEMTQQLGVGELSQPFKTDFGWHLLQVLDKRSSDVTAQASRERAQQMLFNRKFAEESRNWLEEIRKEAYIELIEQANN